MFARRQLSRLLGSFSPFKRQLSTAIHTAQRPRSFATSFVLPAFAAKNEALLSRKTTGCVPSRFLSFDLEKAMKQPAGLIISTDPTLYERYLKKIHDEDEDYGTLAFGIYHLTSLEPYSTLKQMFRLDNLNAISDDLLQEALDRHEVVLNELLWTHEELSEKESQSHQDKRRWFSSALALAREIHNAWSAEKASRMTFLKTKYSRNMERISPETVLEMFEDWSKHSPTSKALEIYRRSLFKPDPLIPNQLSNQTFKQIEKTELSQLAVKAIFDRQDGLKQINATNSKEKNFLVGLHSPPGGGKSFSLDLISSMGLDKEKLMSIVHAVVEMEGKTPTSESQLSERKAFLSRVVGLTINHVQGSEPVLEEENEGLFDECVGWRILHSFFMNIRKMDFETFFRTFQPLIRMSSDLALRTVYFFLTKDQAKDQGETQIKPHLLLCVDEILYSKNSKKFITILGKISDSFPWVTVFVSTLNSKLLQIMGQKHTVTSTGVRNSSESGRLIEWLPVHPLTMEQSLELFEDLSPLTKPYLYSALCMANGHPRTLESIYQAARELKDKPLIPTTDFIKSISNSFNAPPLNEMLVMLALNGDVLNVGERCNLPGMEDLSTDSLISLGYYFNTINPKKTSFFRPRLSALRLIHRFFDAEEDISERRGRFANLKALLELPIPSCRGSSNDSQLMDYFEMFHAYWEDIKRISFAKGQNKTAFLVQDLYGAPNQGSVKEGGLVFGQDCTISITPKIREPNKRFVQLQSTKDYAKELNMIHNGSRTIFDVVLRAPKNNPGFDLLIAEKRIKSNGEAEEPILILIECESEHPNTTVANSQFKPGDFRSKIRNCMQMFNRNLKGSSGGLQGLESLSQVYIVFALFNEVSQKTIDDVVTEMTSIKNDRLLNLHTKSEDALFPVDLQSCTKETESLSPKDRLYNAYKELSPLPNIVILPRHHLLKLYTPTLSFIPAFLTDQEIKVHDIVSGTYVEGVAKHLHSKKNQEKAKTLP